MREIVRKMERGIQRIVQLGCRQEPGIDGILVTVGLCVIALDRKSTRLNSSHMA